MFNGHLKKGLIRCVGKDVPFFLNSTSTNTIPTGHGSPGGVFTNFLNAHGRLLYDSFVYKNVDGGEYFLDCHSMVVEQFIYHLRQYSLRKDVTFTDVSEEFLVGIGSSLDSFKNEAVAIVKDERLSNAPAMFRGIVRRNITSLANDITKEYKQWRMINGVTEGPDEYVRCKGIPLEYNMDLMGAINTDKGCYLGQEFISRTLRKGIVRKRVIPFRTANIPLRKWDAGPVILDSKGKKCGKVINSIEGGFNGLALMYLSSLNRKENCATVATAEDMIDLSGVYDKTDLWINYSKEVIPFQSVDILVVEGDNVKIPIILDGVPKWWPKLRRGLCFD